MIRPAADPLNSQAKNLEDTETEIRQLIQDEFFKKTPPREIGRKVDKLIASALKTVKIPALREAAVKSLRAFAQKQYDTYRRSFGSRIDLILAAVLLSRGGANKAEQRKAERTLLPGFTAAQTAQPAKYGGEPYSDIVTLGVPMKKYAEDYLRENVRPALDRLCRQQARDPDDVSGRNTLRNRAEMEVRYQDHQDNIQRLRDGGNKLVVASTHSDCSERCRPWQGRVYSLDGTSGTTDDGRKYVPLETATDVWYTTKAGKQYKNGLLGFNCRHYLTEYKSGVRAPRQSPQEEARQYAITQEQRRLERNVREWKVRALQYKNAADKKSYAYAKKKATEWDKKYGAFCMANNRPIYPSRVKVV